MMDRPGGGGDGGRRMMGDYIVGPKIGSGSFAVVRRSWHVRSGHVVAVKEIDRKQLSAKLYESLLKEITILGEINHPNIVRLHDVIETGEKIYLVLEYCTAGDLAAYIHHLGRVSEFDARHFMRHLVERLSFEEFFNHKFLAEPIPMVVSGHPTTLPGSLQLVRHKGLSSDNLLSTSHKELTGSTGGVFHTHGDLPTAPRSSSHDCTDVLADCSMERSFCSSGLPTSSVSDSLKTVTTEPIPLSTSTARVNDSLESIVREYILVNVNIASMESISSSLVASMQDQSGSKCVDCSFTKTEKSVDIPLQCGEIPTASISGAWSLGSHGSVSSAMLQASYDSREVARVQILVSARLRLLHNHAHALSALAEEKLNLGRQLDAFSVELVALTVWKEALGLCKLLADSTTEASTSHGVLPCLSHEQEGSSTKAIDFSWMESVCSRVEQGFIAACDRAENLASFLHDVDGNAEMPDAMEIIFQPALTAGKNGAVDELMGNMIKAASAYSKATDFLSFILTEATSLPLNPPFRMDASERQRLQRYLVNLKAHQNLSIWMSSL